MLLNLTYFKALGKVFPPTCQLKRGKCSMRVYYARIRWAGDKPLSLIVKRAKVKHAEFAVITNGLSGQFAPVTYNKSILATESKNAFKYYYSSAISRRPIEITEQFNPIAPDING